MTVCSVPRPFPADVDLAARFPNEVQPFFDPLHRRARGLTRCDADAEDLFQDTLLHAYAGFGTFREGSNLEASALRILYNRWVASTASNDAAERRYPSTTSPNGTWPAAPRDCRWRCCPRRRACWMPYRTTRSRRHWPRCRKDSGRLSTTPDIQGYSCAEIASMLNIPHGTVMSRVSRGRRRLRIALAHVAQGRDVA